LDVSRTVFEILPCTARQEAKLSLG